MQIILWTHPRSVSTAFERTIAERGDLEVLHEPFSELYYGYDQKAKAVEYQTQYDFAPSYPNIKKYLLTQFQTKRDFFIKDMAYHCWDYIQNDFDWLKEILPVFLIRDPKKSIASNYAMNTDLQLEEVGYERLWNLYELYENQHIYPLVLQSEKLQEDPLKTYTLFEAYCGLEHKPESLEWKKEAPSSWKAWGKWHKDAAESKKIEKKERKYKYTVDNNALLNDYYQRSLPFFNKLAAKAKKSWNDEI